MKRYHFKGFDCCPQPSASGDYVEYEDALAAMAAEREACARVLSDLAAHYRELGPPYRALPVLLDDCARAIRARSPAREPEPKGA